MTKRNYIGILLVLLLCAQDVFAVSYYFYVQLSDKNNSPYLLTMPEEYLSERSLVRRSLFQIPIDSTDLPVNPAYVQQIAELGVRIHSRTKWLNGLTVVVDDSSVMQVVRDLPFVVRAQYTGRIDAALPVSQKMRQETEAVREESSLAQLVQVNGKSLHDEGFSGHGIHIAVLDAGFKNVDVNPGFDSLRLQGRLLGTKDVVLPGNNVFAEDSHGANVLSIMAGNLPGQYMGTAPHASYWLIRTEYVPTEFLVETDFWVAGIEFADSVGVDVVNSSLGYTTFDDVSMNFGYNDMNGSVSRASIAATIAARKGIVVCNSAGNDGARSWKYIGSPADAERIIAVGSVTSTGEVSPFSSFGPTFDGRIKPEIVARGSATSLINPLGTVVAGNGTSYSSPVIAGMAACLLQLYRVMNPLLEINKFIEAVTKSGHLYENPSEQLGYGIPDFRYAIYQLPFLNSLAEHKGTDAQFVDLYQQNKTLYLKKRTDCMEQMTARVYQLNGAGIVTKQLVNSMETITLDNFPVGIYLLRIECGGMQQRYKVVLK